MKSNPIKAALSVSFFILVTATTMSSADATSNFPTTFPDGANSLFAGNSFFAPVARDFNELAVTNGFSDHQTDVVFVGGMAGTPANLWADTNNRALIAQGLSAGDIELFGLAGIGSPIDETTIQDYRNWFDLAISFNLNTRFAIAQPWVAGGPSRDTRELGQAIVASGDNTFEVVQQLRAEYPDNEIAFVNYGITAAIMKDRFESGDLPDVLSLLPDPANMIDLDQALFEDEVPGHAGPMIHELSALTWMGVLYGADISALITTDYESDVTSIVNEVLEFNQQYLPTAVPEPNTLMLALFGIFMSGYGLRPRSRAKRCN